MGSSPYEIVIDNKQRNEVQISLMMPKDRTSVNHNFHAFIFIRKKENVFKRMIWMNIKKMKILII